MSTIYKDCYGTCPMDNTFTCIEVKYVGLKVLGYRNEIFKRAGFSCIKLDENINCHEPNNCPLYISSPLTFE